VTACRDVDLVTLAAATSGAVLAADLLTAGVNRRRLRYLLDAGVWQSPFPRVVVLFSGPLMATTAQHAALLYAGAGATLSHETAGSLWRLCRPSAFVHVTVPYSRSVRAQAGLVVHRSRSLVGEDVHPALSPRRTRIERTVIDLLAHRPTADAALSLVADALRDRATTPDRLRDAMYRSTKAPWRDVVLSALPDLSDGAQSVLEIKDATMRRRHGLPSGVRQFGRRANGVEYLDVVIEEFRVHIELDGRLGHDRANEIWRDMRRDNRSEVEGLRHLRYGWGDMVHRPCEVAREQAGVLHQQGWTGRFVRCRNCPPTP
jgi:hypothetical protein